MEITIRGVRPEANWGKRSTYLSFCVPEACIAPVPTLRPRTGRNDLYFLIQHSCRRETPQQRERSLCDQ